MPRARSIRILGSGVLNFAWVACGRLSAYWEPELSPWDTAAGTLLIEGAPQQAHTAAADTRAHAYPRDCARAHAQTPRRLCACMSRLSRPPTPAHN